MALSIGEILARRKLDKNEEGQHEFYLPGQHKAVAVDDKAMLSWVDSVGRLVMAAAHKVEDVWVLVKPAHVISIGLNGQMDVHRFAASYRFDEKQVNALNEATAKKAAKKKESE